MKTNRLTALMSSWVLVPMLLALTSCTTIDGKDISADESPTLANAKTSARAKSSRQKKGQSQAVSDDPLSEITADADKANAPANNSAGSDTSAESGNAVGASGAQAAAEETQGSTQGPAQSGSVQVTNIRFRGNQNGGTIVLSTSEPAQYRVRKNASHNQVVIELVNAVLPIKLKRPYITKEFSSPITSFTAYQNTGSPVVRVVVQMKNSSGIFMQQEGNSLMGMPSGNAANRITSAQGAKGGGNSNRPIVNAAGDSSDGAGAVAGDGDETPAQAMYSNTTTDSSEGSKTKALDKALSNDLADFMSGNLKFYGHEISMEYQNADVRDVLNQIADESGLNMIISEDVKGPISIRLRQVPWDQALVLVLQTKSLAYIRQGRVLRIAPLSSLKKEAEDTQAALASQVTLAPLRTRVVKLSHAKPADLVAMVKTFLSKPRGQVSADLRTNAMVVTDTDQVLAQVTELLLRLDRPTPQVLIEGKVIESQENVSSDFGIKWLSNSSGISLGYATVSAASAPFAATTAGFVMSTDILGDLSARIGLLEKTDRVKVLSSPRIVTLSGQKAEITTNYQFPTYPQQVTATPGSGNVTTSVPEYKTVKVIDLAVTPLVSADGRIRLDINIRREFAGPVDAGAGATGARPIFSRTADSSLVVKNGQTAVLGGAYNADETYGDDHFPILGNVPIIGNLFKHKVASAIKSELMIFLTPTLVE